MNRRRALAGVGVLALVTGGYLWYARSDSDPPSAPAPTEDAGQEERVAREAVRDRPNDAHARARLARALRRLGRGREAEPELMQAIRLGLPEGEAQREYVLLLAPQNWPDKFEGLFQRVARDNPNDRELLRAIADSYATKGMWDRVEPLCTQLLALDPGHQEWRFQRGVARMRTAYHAKAADDFRAVLTHDPKNYQARLFLAHSLLGDARMAEAERELRVCTKDRPNDVEPLIGLATCEFERNNLSAAQELLTRAAERAGNSPLVLQEQATLYLRQQRTELALATLKRLVELHPDHRQGHLQLAQVYLAAGNEAEARRHEQIYQELDRKEEARLAAQRGMR
ncbi:tetratricopeptide repeat protein [Frigoriglobus tundricola]|uniref:Uncharacterized protein n=1 Tax=Frigoriglobus tundricola TaxID=2774151 RepID=A0A6M5Z4X2_9BACT|nr:tetratricopeptide repeat protein [Frigoriglobus tundricola]QJX00837.1 hypothetical protein FTUN_8475 [Frigoriglobus tundricola]